MSVPSVGRQHQPHRACVVDDEMIGDLGGAQMPVRALVFLVPVAVRAHRDLTASQWCPVGLAPDLGSASPRRHQPPRPRRLDRLDALLALHHHHRVQRLGCGHQLRQPPQRTIALRPLRYPVAVVGPGPLPEVLGSLAVVAVGLQPLYREHDLAGGVAVPVRGHDVGLSTVTELDVAGGQVLAFPRSFLGFVGRARRAGLRRLRRALDPERVADLGEPAPGEAVDHDRALVAPTDRQRRLHVVMGRAQRLVLVTGSFRVAAMRHERLKPHIQFVLGVALVHTAASWS